MAITALLAQDGEAAKESCGLIRYNGYTLCPARRYTINVEPVYDRANRTIISRKFLLKGIFLVYAPTNVTARAPTDPTEPIEAAQMTRVRNALSVPGQRLTLTGLGFGDIDIGEDTPITSYYQPGVGDVTIAGTTRLKDVEFGPKPQVMSCDPIGGLLAWEVEWIIEFQLGYTDSNNIIGAGNILAFNYESETSIDHRGLTTRTISGYWQVAQLAPGIGGPDAAKITPASELKNQLMVTVPNGFRRRSQKFKDNDAKNICNFSFVDEELTGPAFPQGIVDANVDLEMENEDLAFSTWRATISGMMESMPGAPRTLATQKFVAIVQDKMDSLRAAFKMSGKRGTIIPEKFRIKGSLFSRQFNFAFTYIAQGCLKDIIVAAGMYSPLPESKWDRWAVSLQNVWQPGGTGQLTAPVEIIFSTNDKLSEHPIQAAANGYQDKAGKLSGVFDVGEVSEANSWLDYENHLRIVSTSAYEIQKISQEVAPNSFSLFGTTSGLVGFTPNAAGIGAKLASQPGGAASAGAQMKPDQIKFTGKATQYVIQYGKALRIKYPPAIPTLDRVGGGRAILVDQEIEPGIQVSSVGADDVPVFAARWAQLYQMPEGFTESGLPASTNPTACPPAKGITELQK